MTFFRLVAFKWCLWWTSTNCFDTIYKSTEQIGSGMTRGFYLYASPYHSHKMCWYAMSAQKFAWSYFYFQNFIKSINYLNYTCWTIQTHTNSQSKFHDMFFFNSKHLSIGLACIELIGTRLLRAQWLDSSRNCIFRDWKLDTDFFWTEKW